MNKEDRRVSTMRFRRKTQKHYGLMRGVEDSIFPNIEVSKSARSPRTFLQTHIKEQKK
jgi:hypothetical protein